MERTIGAGMGCKKGRQTQLWLGGVCSCWKTACGQHSPEMHDEEDVRAGA